MLIWPLTQYFCATEIRLKLTSRAGRGAGERPRGQQFRCGVGAASPSGEVRELSAVFIQVSVLPPYPPPDGSPCTENSVKQQPPLVFYFPPNEHTWDARPWARLGHRLQHRHVRLWLAAGPREAPLPAVPLRRPPSTSSVRRYSVSPALGTELQPGIDAK